MIGPVTGHPFPVAIYWSGNWSRAHSLGANVTVSVVSVGLTYNLYYIPAIKPSCYDKYIMLRIQSITVRFSVHHCGQVNTFELQDAGTPCAYTDI